jgi:hypothetical protein
MEDKNKNKTKLKLEEFINLIHAHTGSEYDKDFLFTTIEETLISFNNKNPIANVTLKQDKNITSNVVYFVALESSEEYQFVLKIRKGDSPMAYENEVLYLKILEKKDLIPKQFLNIAAESNKIKISIEEFINATHIPDTDPYNENYMEAIVKNLAEFHSIETINYNYNNFYSNNDKNFIYLEYLINKYTPKSKRRFGKLIAEYASSENEIK